MDPSLKTRGRNHAKEAQFFGGVQGASGAGSTLRSSIRSLVERDALGVICEQYPSAYNIRTLGHEYGRPWVSRFADGFKAIGPSVSGFELLDVGGRDGFDRPKRASDPDAEQMLGEWIDDYRERYRDRREETTEFEPPTEEELKALHALGYND